MISAVVVLSADELDALDSLAEMLSLPRIGGKAALQSHVVRLIETHVHKALKAQREEIARGEQAP